MPEYRITVERIDGDTVHHLASCEITSHKRSVTRQNGFKKEDYVFRFTKYGPLRDQTFRVALVKNFDLIRRSIWDLFYLGLREAVGKRNENNASGGRTRKSRAKSESYNQLWLNGVSNEKGAIDYSRKTVYADAGNGMRIFPCGKALLEGVSDEENCDCDLCEEVSRKLKKGFK